MATTLVQLLNGGFQDNTGAPLSNGYLLCTLSHDSTYFFLSPFAQIVAGVRTKIRLDNNGNVAGVQSLWANAALTPASSYYTVEAYNSKGLKVWQAPQYWTIAASAPTIDIGEIISTNP